MDDSGPAYSRISNVDSSHWIEFGATRTKYVSRNFLKLCFSLLENTLMDEEASPLKQQLLNKYRSQNNLRTYQTNSLESSSIANDEVSD